MILIIKLYMEQLLKFGQVDKIISKIYLLKILVGYKLLNGF
jgi:hypothetical protein